MVAQEPTEKIRSLMLSSELYHHAGELKKQYATRKRPFINQSEK
jgi:hypothetical protein